MPLSTEQRKTLLKRLTVKFLILKNGRKRSSARQICKDNFGEFHHLHVELRADDNLFRSHTINSKYHSVHARNTLRRKIKHIFNSAIFRGPFRRAPITTRQDSSELCGDSFCLRARVAPECTERTDLVKTCH